MSEQINIAYHEVDFLLPIHRFDIRFSYVTKKGLPFIREFVLRLVHISPMKLSDIATFFGFSDIEVEEALGVAFYFSAQERHRQAGRSAPDPAEFVDLLCHNSIQFCERLSGWVK